MKEKIQAKIEEFWIQVAMIFNSIDKKGEVILGNRACAFEKKIL